jgi:hypothetical protein
MSSMSLERPVTGSWAGDFPGSRLALQAVLDALADSGYEALSVEEIQHRVSRVGGVLGMPVDLEHLVATAIEQVRLFRTPEPSGSLKGDLLILLRPWLAGQDRQARAVGAVFSASQWSPRLQEAVIEALDRPLKQALGVILSRARVVGEGIPAHRLHALNWILRSVAVDRLRTPAARSPIDLEQLIDLLLAA